jgi:hypothetical protein
MALKFSQRKGLTPIRVEIQRDSIDSKLKNKLWSVIHTYFFDGNLGFFYRYDFAENSGRDLWKNFFGCPIDEYPSTVTLYRVVREYFFQKDSWANVYDLIEVLAYYIQHPSYTMQPPGFEEQFFQEINCDLEQELSAYRLINGKIVEITSEHEIVGIEQALQDASPLSNVHTHLTTALKLLSDRQNPDYRNSAKESISAVEALCQIITGDSTGEHFTLFSRKISLV